MMRLVLLLASSLLCMMAKAQDFEPSVSDFGGAGLLQTPSARMFDEGEVGFSVSHTQPYTRGSLLFQPLNWLEANIRYTDVSNREYDPSHTISTQSFKDKGIDFKFRLAREDFYQPMIALGFRDIGGTSLFGSEFLVASKRFDNVDISLGLAWGYLGNRSDMNNPLALVFGSRMNDRPGRTPNDQGGTVQFNSLFRGKPAVFAGMEYQTPYQPLSIKVEYEGNNYQYEPLKNPQDQDSRINFATVWTVNDAFNIQAGYERGNTAMLGITIHTNYAKKLPLPKISEQAVQPFNKEPTKTDNWPSISRQIQTDAGYQVHEIAQRKNEIVIRGEQQKYYHPAQGMGRASRILYNNTNNETQWFTFIDEQYGIPVKETSIPREAFFNYANNDTDIGPLQRSLAESSPTNTNSHSVYLNPVPERFSYGIGLGYKQNWGGPDKFLLYQLSIDADADYFFNANNWWSGSLSGAILDNFDEFKYDGPSLLPRVRTDLRRYLTESNFTMPVFQLNNTMQLSDNVYSLAYAGMLETMYGGVGGEVLYRPFGERWALGIDLNWVKQRAYEQDFNLRQYETVTGHITSYWNTGFNGILVTTSVGRYLAKDYGLTLDISRTFRNGLTMGGYATRTDVPASEFGEGSFNKGIYISIPLDLLLTSFSLRQAVLQWSPLTRDGGAKLSRRYSLYPLTEDRNLDRFHNGLEKIRE